MDYSTKVKRRLAKAALATLALCLFLIAAAASASVVEAATPRVSFDRTSLHINESILVSISGFDPSTPVRYRAQPSSAGTRALPWTSHGLPYQPEDVTDASGSHSTVFSFSEGFQPGPTTICAMQANGTGACKEFLVLPAIPKAANVIALLGGAIVFLLFALVLRKQWIHRLPGLQSGRTWRTLSSLVAYVVIGFSFLFIPFASFGAILAAVAIFNIRYAISNLRSPELPKPIRNIAWVRTLVGVRTALGWSLGVLFFLGMGGVSIALLVFAVSDQSDPTADLAGKLLVLALVNAVLLAPFALIGLYVAVWGIAAKAPPSTDPNAANGPPGRRLPAFLTLALVPAFALAGLKLVDKKTGFIRRACWSFVIACWIAIDATLAAGATYEAFFARDPGWSGLFWLPVRYLVCGLVIGLGVWVVRHGYDLTMGRDSGDERPSTSLFADWLSAFRRLAWQEKARFAAAGLLLIAVWTTVIALAAWPWMRVEMIAVARGANTVASSALPAWVQGLAGAIVMPAPKALAIGRLLAVILAAVPVIAVSIPVIGLALPTGPEAGKRLHFKKLLRRVTVCALIAAVAFVFAAALVEYSSSLVEHGTGEPLTILIMGVCVGLTAGLGLGMATAFGVRRRWAETSVGLTAIGFCALVVFILIFLGVQEWNAHTAGPSATWIAVSAAGIGGLYLGFIAGDTILIPGFKAFSASAQYLGELFWPLVGFAAGYIFIFLFFGGVYFSVHESSSCTGASAPFAPASGSNLDMCKVGFRDFVFYSLNTIAPLGYSDIRPANDTMKGAAALEIGAGIAWTLVVFGALLANLNDRHVRKIVMESLAQTFRRPTTPNAAGAPFNSVEVSERIGAVLSLDEQLSLVSELKRRFWQLPAQRDAVLELMQKMKGKRDLFHLPAQELDAALALAEGINLKSSAPRERMSASLTAVTVAALAIVGLTGIAEGISATVSSHPPVGDTCVVGHWVLQNERIRDPVGLNLSGGSGSTLTVDKNGTAIYKYEPEAQRLVDTSADVTSIEFQLEGMAVSQVLATPSGAWSERPLWSQGHQYKYVEHGTELQSDAAWPTTFRTYSCSRGTLTLASNYVNANYDRAP